MHYFYIKGKDGNILATIRTHTLSASWVNDIVNYAVVRDAGAFGAAESHWDNAVAFDLYPCVEFDGREFITIHEPAQGSE